jgi:hypothetical protein
MRTKKHVPALSTHARCIIFVRKNDEVDLIDPVTGHWQTFPTARSARWHASVWTRLQAGFGAPQLSDKALARAVVHIAGQNQDIDPETAAFIARMEHSFPHLAGDAE